MKKLYIIFGVILCLLAPCTASAASLTDTIKYVQKSEKMTKTGYTQQKVAFKALPSVKSKTLKKIKVNTELKYRKYNKSWAMTIYNGRLGFVKIKQIKQPDYTPSYFKRMGIIRYNGWRWTWYSQRVLPGGGLKIPGRHVDKATGFVCDQDGYICLASNNIGYHKVVSTPFGRKGKIYDSGCSGIDMYVSW